MATDELPKGCLIVSKAIGAIIGTAVGLLIPYFLCRIDPGIESGWLRGLWHGANFVGNCVISIFDGRLIQAPIHTTAYSVFWWIFAILSIIIMLSMIPGIYRMFKDQ
jgi:hypothetical protein